MTILPIPKNEKDRLKALHDYQILDSLNEDEFDRITRLASLICDVPISLISLTDDNRQWFKSKVGLTLKETSRDIAICQYAIMDTVLYEVEDATKDFRFKDNYSIINNKTTRFYAGQPLVDPNGYVIGTLCVTSNISKILTENQKEGLKLLADETISLIVERKQKEELKHFEKLFQLTNDLVFIGGKDGYFKKINPAFEKLLGWSEEYILSMSLFKFIHPDDVESTKRELNKLALGYKTINFTQRLKTKSDLYKTIQWTTSPEPLTGNIFGIGRYITEEKLKEQQLAVSEEKLRGFFENSQGLMCTHNLDGQFLSVNTAGAAILGYTINEILKLSLFDLVPEDRHSEVTMYLSKIKTDGDAKGQMITRHKNGSLRVWLFNNSLEILAAGENYVIGNGIDITERYQLEKELKRTRAMLEQTSKVARVGGWEFDIKKQKIFWTPITKEIHGVSVEYEPDLITAIDFYKPGESRDIITRVLNEAIKEGKPYDVQLQIVTLKGEEIWVRALGNAEFNNGACTRLYGTFQDINDFKIAEHALKKSIDIQGSLNNALIEKIERIKEQDHTIEKIKEFKFLADSIPQIIWTTQPDGTVDYYNQYWFNYSGLSLQETLERSWLSVMHPDDLQKCLTEWTHSFNTGLPFKAEYRLKRDSDGVYKWHLGRAQPMKNEEGKIIKWFGSSIDIDEYKRAIDLQNTISHYEDFNRIVAHNLRGPAGSIEMIINMIIESADEEEIRELLPMLKQSSTTLNETLNELMKVLEVRNNYNLPYDDCNLVEIVKGVERMLKGQIVSKKATISTDFKQAIVKFPKVYLESIFYNLISNALKYSKAGVPPDILIHSETASNKVLLSFKDNGLGIDLKKHKGNIFKLNKIFHRGFDSKGVGLFMTKTQIETFGGKITVESEPNIGSEFKVEI